MQSSSSTIALQPLRSRWSLDADIITSILKTTTNFILLLVPNNLISNPSSNGPKSLLFQHCYLIILVILYFSKIPLSPMPLLTFLTPTTITVHREKNGGEFQATIPAETSIPTVQLRVHHSRRCDHAQPQHVSRWARIKAKLCSYSCC